MVRQFESVLPGLRQRTRASGSAMVVEVPPHVLQLAEGAGEIRSPAHLRNPQRQIGRWPK
jgi:hypothetical protein